MTKEEKKDIPQLIFDKAASFVDYNGDWGPDGDEDFKKWLIDNFTFIVSKGKTEAHYQEKDEIPDLKPGEFQVNYIKLSDEDTNPDILQAEVDALRDISAFWFKMTKLYEEQLDKTIKFCENLIQLQRE